MSQLSPYLEAGAAMAGGLNPRLHAALQRRQRTQINPPSDPRVPRYDYRDRAAIENQKYANQAALIAQRQAGQQMQAQGMSQAERLHMMKLQNGLVAIQKAVTDHTLTPEQGAHMALQVQTGLSPYLLKQQQTNLAIANQKLQGMLDQAEMSGMGSTIYKNFVTNNPKGYERIKNEDGSTTYHSVDLKGTPHWHHEPAPKEPKKEKTPSQLLKESHDEEKASNPETIGQSDAELAKNKEFGQRLFNRHQKKLADQGKTDQLTGPFGGSMADFLKNYPQLKPPERQASPGASGTGGDFEPDTPAPGPLQAPAAGGMTGAVQPPKQVSDDQLRAVLGIGPPPEE